MRVLWIALLFLPLLQDEEKGTTADRPLLLERATEEQKKLLERYRYGKKEDGKFAWTLRKLSERDDFVRYSLSFPSAVVTSVEENNTVHAKYWVPAKGGKPFPGVVVLHWLKGNFQALDIVCAGLAKKGICALMVYMPHY
ncbi:MAG: hypothetical protein ACYTAF_13750, partial [Planctomycetota bacterium]